MRRRADADPLDRGPCRAYRVKGSPAPPVFGWFPSGWPAVSSRADGWCPPSFIRDELYAQAQHLAKSGGGPGLFPAVEIALRDKT
jgi:hypothetical protein